MVVQVIEIVWLLLVIFDKQENPSSDTMSAGYRVRGKVIPTRAFSVRDQKALKMALPAHDLPGLFRVGLHTSPTPEPERLFDVADKHGLRRGKMAQPFQQNPLDLSGNHY